MIRFFSQCFLIMIFVVHAYGQVPNTQPTTQNHVAKIIPTRQNQFFIPFEVTPSLRKDVQEVELVYSTDLGENWFSYQKTSPDKKRFPFSAKNDGEYWFIFRLIHFNGEVKLAQPTIPSIRVLVDTLPPKIQLNAKQEKADEVVIDWQVEDSALSENVPEIYLSYDLNVTWIRLAVDEKKIEKTNNRISGQTVFYPPRGSKNIDIRFEMTDVAGNREIKTAKLDFSKTDQAFVGSNNELTGTTDNHLPIAVLPPRPMLKSELSSPQNPQNEPSTKGLLSDLNLGIETSIPQNAESLPRYASEMTAVPEEQSTENVADLKLPLLDLDLTGNGLPPVSSTLPTVQATQPNLNLPPTGTSSGTMVTIPEIASTQPGSSASSAPDPSSAQKNEQENSQETSSGETIKNELEPLFPGKITLISMKQSVMPVLIVRWHSGDETEFKESKVDIYRADTKQGPWLPVAFDLTNTGEYLWNISETEFTPFYLRVDLRSVKGLYTDFTSREINLMNVVKPK